MPSVLILVNRVITESVISVSATLDKEFFAECPIKNIRQSVKHSTKSGIPIVHVYLEHKYSLRFKI
jgi:chorismate mutase